MLDPDRFATINGDAERSPLVDTVLGMNVRNRKARLRGTANNVLVGNKYRKRTIPFGIRKDETGSLGLTSAFKLAPHLHRNIHELLS